MRGDILEQSMIENEDPFVEIVDEEVEVNVPDEVLGDETKLSEIPENNQKQADSGGESKVGSKEMAESEEIVENPVQVDEVPDEPSNVVKEDMSEEISDASDIVNEMESISEYKPVEISNIEIKGQFITSDEFEDKVADLKSALDELNQRVDEGFSSNEEHIYEIVDGMGARADRNEFRKLKRDFKVFSKRLHMVAKEADATGAEVLDATKIPADVLEITYRKTLNDLYSAILNEFGEREAVEIVEGVVDDVRKSSAGVDLLSFEDGKFTINKLAEAIDAKLISPKQLHSTYVEFFRQLSECVPGYEARDFKSFVETGSREYAVDEISIHAKRLGNLEAELNDIKSEISKITEHFTSIEEVEDERADEIKENVDKLLNVSEKMGALANAINSHTRFIKKLNENIGETQSVLESHKSEISDTFDTFSSHVEGTFENKADRSEIQDIVVNLSSLKDEAESSIENLSSELDNGLGTKADAILMDNLIGDVVAFREEFSKLQEEVVLLRSINKLPTIERVVCSTLDGFGNTTMKKLEDRILSDGTEIHGDKLFAIIYNLEKRCYITYTKKVRYTYYSLNR